MEKTDTKKSTSMNLGCFSWASVVLSLGIIGIRAFQPGAQPIETWSVWSWCLMLLPMVIPLVLSIAFIFVWAISFIVCEVFCKT